MQMGPADLGSSENTKGPAASSNARATPGVALGK